MWKVSALAVGVFVVACGGNGGGSAAGGNGGAGTGGAAGSATGGASGAGGNSGAVRGAVSLHILAPSGCSLTDQYLDFPQMASGHPVTDTQKVEAAVDGSTTASGDPVRVQCNLIGTQAPYTLDALIDIGLTGNDRFISLGSSQVVGGTAEGGLVVDGRDLPGSYGSTPAGPCTYAPIELDVASHSVWGSFTCGAFDSDSGDSCAVGASYYFFENCTLK